MELTHFFLATLWYHPGQHDFLSCTKAGDMCKDVPSLCHIIIFLHLDDHQYKLFHCYMTDWTTGSLCCMKAQEINILLESGFWLLYVSSVVGMNHLQNPMLELRRKNCSPEWMVFPQCKYFKVICFYLNMLSKKIPHRPIGLGSQMKSKIKWDLITLIIFWEDHNSLYFCKVDFDCYMSVQ